MPVPIVRINSITPSPTGMLFYGWLQDDGGLLCSTGFDFGPSIPYQYQCWAGNSIRSPADILFDFPVSNYTPGQMYHVRAWAANAAGFGYSPDVSVPGYNPAPAPPPDTSWPWPLDAVQGWFEDFYNTIVGYFDGISQAVYDALGPAINEIWYWIQSVQNYLESFIRSFFSTVFAWIQSAEDAITHTIVSIYSSIATWIDQGITRVINTLFPLITSLSSWITAGFTDLRTTILGFLNNLATALSGLYNFITAKVLEVNKWFSDEFIDPFIDWLVPFPVNLVKAFGDWITAVFRDLTAKLQTPGSPPVNFLGAVANIWMSNFLGIFGLAGPAAISAVKWVGETLLSMSAPIGQWFTEVFSKMAGWVTANSFQVPEFVRQFMPVWGTSTLENFELLIPPLGYALKTGPAIASLVFDQVITPAIGALFTWAEGQGEVNPSTGRNQAAALAKVAGFTMGGLTAMTVAGELLHPLKQLGLGNIAAMLYDFINYKVLTAAFMGVLALVYVQKPLTYYYQRIARPNIPNEQHLALMTEQRIITPAEFKENMTWQGYPDTWIEKIEGTLYRPMTPYMLRSLAEAGLLDDSLLEHALNQAGYDDTSKPYIKRMMANLASTALAAVSSSTAMTRYQEGFDDETALRKNLSALGIADSMLDRYAFAAQLKYLYDYQSDLKVYYIDLYHRREIEEPELRTSLVSVGLSPERLDLVVAQQKIKRLAPSRPAEDPAVSVQLDTIRDRRKKSLITREQEIAQLVGLGKELSYATAVADNDDVAMTPAGTVVARAEVPKYETEAGKIQVDTIRRLRRSTAISAADELAALTALEMPLVLAQAIVDNDELRIRKSSGTE